MPEKINFMGLMQRPYVRNTAEIHRWNELLPVLQMKRLPSYNSIILKKLRKNNTAAGRRCVQTPVVIIKAPAPVQRRPKGIERIVAFGTAVIVRFFHDRHCVLVGSRKTYMYTSSFH